VVNVSTAGGVALAFVGHLSFELRTERRRDEHVPVARHAMTGTVMNP